MPAFIMKAFKLAYVFLMHATWFHPCSNILHTITITVLQMNKQVIEIVLLLAARILVRLDLVGFPYYLTLKIKSVLHKKTIWNHTH